MQDEEDVVIESKISKTLSANTTRIVIILVLVLLIILPLFTTDIYVTTVTTHENGLKLLGGVYNSGNWTAF